MLEAALSVPMLVLILTAAGMMVMWSIKNYFSVMADVELHQEIQMAFQRVVENALEAKAIKRSTRFDEIGYDIFKRSLALKDYGYGDKDIVKRYWINNVGGTLKLVEGRDAAAPLTGDSATAEVVIEEFACQEVEGKQGLYIIRLRGKSYRTAHVYSLETAIFTYPDRGQL